MPTLITAVATFVGQTAKINIKNGKKNIAL